VRIANIDKSALSPAHASGVDLPDVMFQAMRLIPNLSAGRPSFYMSRDMATMLARQIAVDGASSFLTSDTVAGDLRWTERFHGIPVRRVDALAPDEAVVS
jgi:hypothetical protein